MLGMTEGGCVRNSVRPICPVAGETPALLRLHDLARENIELTIFLFSHFGDFKWTNLITAHD